MVEFEITGNKYELKIDGTKKSNSEFLDYLNNGAFKPKFNFSIKALFWGFWALLIDVGLIDALIKSRHLKVGQWLAIIFVNTMFFVTLYSIKKLKVKFTGSKEDLKNLKNLMSEINNSTGPFSVETVKSHKGHDKKLNSGCDRTVNMKKVKNKKSKFFNSNIKFPCYQTDEATICLLPFFMLEISKDGSAYLSNYSKQTAPGRGTITTPNVPKDGEVESTTWAKVNKNGTKDKRFKDNFQLYRVVHYSYYFSATGNIVRLYFYNKNIMEIFKELSSFGQSIAETNDKSQENQKSHTKSFNNETNSNPNNNTQFLGLIINTSLAVMNADGEVLDSELTMLRAGIISLIPNIDFDINTAIINQHKKMTLLLSNKSQEQDFLSIFISSELSLEEKVKALGVAIQVAFADGHLHKNEENVLLGVAKILGIDPSVVKDHIKECNKGLKSVA